MYDYYCFPFLYCIHFWSYLFVYLFSFLKSSIFLCKNKLSTVSYAWSFIFSKELQKILNCITTAGILHVYRHIYVFFINKETSFVSILFHKISIFHFRFVSSNFNSSLATDTYTISREFPLNIQSQALYACRYMIIFGYTK